MLWCAACLSSKTQACSGSSADSSALHQGAIVNSPEAGPAGVEPFHSANLKARLRSQELSGRSCTRGRSRRARRTGVMRYAVFHTSTVRPGFIYDGGGGGGLGAGGGGGGGDAGALVPVAGLVAWLNSAAAT